MKTFLIAERTLINSDGDVLVNHKLRLASEPAVIHFNDVDFNTVQNKAGSKKPSSCAIFFTQLSNEVSAPTAFIYVWSTLNSQLWSTWVGREGERNFFKNKIPLELVGRWRGGVVRLQPTTAQPATCLLIEPITLPHLHFYLPVFPSLSFSLRPVQLRARPSGPALDGGLHRTHFGRKKLNNGKWSTVAVVVDSLWRHLWAEFLLSTGGTLVIFVTETVH